MTIDILLFSLFLSLNLIVGLWYSRGITTLKQYAIGDKAFSNGTITAAIVATHIGSGIIFYGLENTYTQGILFIIPSLLGSLISFWLTARVIVVRMEKFLNHLSIAEAMGKLYGKTIRMITAFSGILFMIGVITIQFKAIPQILFPVFGLEGHWVTFLTAGIIIVYSAFGGIHAVTLTDVLQFIAICICLPILIVTVHNNFLLPSQMTAILIPHTIKLKEFIGWNPACMKFLSLCFFWIFPSHGVNPAQFQRIAMAHSIEQARDTFTYATFFNFLTLASILFLGVLLLVHSDLNPLELVDYIVATHTTFPALKGLLAISVVALAMSTADSYLNASTVLLVNDIIRPLQGIDKKTDPKSKKNNHELTIPRICSLGIGIFALLLTFRFDNLLQLLLLANNVYIPIYLPPFFLAIFGFRTIPPAVLMGMAAGGITVAVWRTCLAYTGIDSLCPGVLANCLVLLASHVLASKSRGKPTG